MSEIKKNIKLFDIDAALDSIDLSFHGYIPSEEALEFFNVIRLVQGEDFEFTTPLGHYWLIDLVFGNISRDQYPYSKEINDIIKIDIKRIAIMMSRGLAKSSLITCFLPVYAAIKGKIPRYGKIYFILSIAASTQGGARVISKSIQSLCEDSVFCNNYFESMRFTETESEFIRKGRGQKAARAFLHRAMGFGSGIRGQRDNLGGRRPDFIFFDDTILNSQAAYSDTIMDSLEEIINSDAINALKGGGKGRIIHVFTPFHMRDPNVKMITSGAYTPVAIPICEKIYEGMPEKEFVGAWPAMHPYEAVMDQYNQALASGSTSSFNQERMLRVSSSEDRMITDDMMQKFKRKSILPNLAAYNIYITTDFTTTSEAKSDYSAMAVWAVNSNRDFFMLDLVVKKQGLTQQYEELFRLVNEWSSYGRAVEVGVEIDGQQRAHIFALEELMRTRNEFFTFARQNGKPPTQKGILSKSSAGSKHERFRLVYPKFQNMKFFFAEEVMDTPDWREAEREMRYTKFDGFGGHDDFMDCISQLGLINIIYPMVQTGSYNPTKVKRASNSIWDTGPVREDPSAYDHYL